MTSTVRELIDAWNTYSADQSWIDIPDQTNRLTIEIIARAGLGYSFSKLSDPSENAFVAAVIRELSYFRLTARTDAIPFYDKLFGQKQKQQHVADNAYVRRQVSDIVEARRRNPTAGPHNDMLDIMLHNTDPDTGEQLDNDNIINQMLTLLVAGSETSANAIAFALHYLSINPDIAAQARAEVDQRWPERTFPIINFGDIAKLRYLRRVVDETLRLWPVAPAYLRKARRDTTLGNGKYNFQQGDWALILLTAAHRTDAWGPDANEFNPDRFLPENLRKLPPYTYKPFGTGPRACIGRQFALHEMVLALAAIVHQFTVEPQPRYQLEVAETMTLKPKDLRLRLHPRR
ncbi:cytochrome P450 [Mycobacterium haemophilum]